MFDTAKDKMLDGREPQNRQDWMIVANFFAHNVEPECAHEVMQLMRVLFDMPLTQNEVKQITQYQLNKHYSRN